MVSKRREFGDRMAAEGATSNIPAIIVLMYGTIALYSCKVTVLCFVCFILPRSLQFGNW